MSTRETVSLILSTLKSTERVTLDVSKDSYLSSGGLRNEMNIETGERICWEKEKKWFVCLFSMFRDQN